MFSNAAEKLLFFHISAEFILYYLWEMYSIEFFVLTLLQKNVLLQDLLISRL